MDKSMLKDFYETFINMDLDETLALELSADTQEEQEFFSLIGNFVLQQRQKSVIDEKRF